MRQAAARAWGGITSSVEACGVGLFGARGREWAWAEGRCGGCTESRLGGGEGVGAGLSNLCVCFDPIVGVGEGEGVEG